MSETTERPMSPREILEKVYRSEDRISAEARAMAASSHRLFPGQRMATHTEPYWTHDLCPGQAFATRKDAWAAGIAAAIAEAEARGRAAALAAIPAQKPPPVIDDEHERGYVNGWNAAVLETASEIHAAGLPFWGPRTDGKDAHQ